MDKIEIMQRIEELERNLNELRQIVFEEGDNRDISELGLSEEACDTLYKVGIVSVESFKQLTRGIILSKIPRIHPNMFHEIGIVLENNFAISIFTAKEKAFYFADEILYNIPLKNHIKRGLWQFVEKQAITSMEELADCSYEELLQVRGLGPVSLQELKEELSKNGYTVNW